VRQDPSPTALGMAPPSREKQQADHPITVVLCDLPNLGKAQLPWADTLWGSAFHSTRTPAAARWFTRSGLSHTRCRSRTSNAWPRAHPHRGARPALSLREVPRALVACVAMNMGKAFPGMPGHEYRTVWLATSA
jgi:hypothetical protein